MKQVECICHSALLLLHLEETQHQFRPVFNTKGDVDFVIFSYIKKVTTGVAPLLHCYC